MCSVSYLSPQVSLTVTGCVLCGIIAFTSTVALPTFVFLSRNGAENYLGYIETHEYIEEDCFSELKVKVYTD